MKPFVPRAQPASRFLAVALSLGLFALVGIAGRELWTKRTGTQLESWLRPVFDTVARARFESWMLPAGVAVAIVGIVFIVVALKPRPKTHVALAAGPNFWIRNLDIARLCTSTAERVPGVARATTYASPRTITVTVSGGERHDDLAERVHAAVSPIVDHLAASRRLQVKHQGSVEDRS